jgi:hypothetical protein
MKKSAGQTPRCPSGRLQCAVSIAARAVLSFPNGYILVVRNGSFQFGRYVCRCSQGISRILPIKKLDIFFVVVRSGSQIQSPSLPCCVLLPPNALLFLENNNKSAFVGRVEYFDYFFNKKYRKTFFEQFELFGQFGIVYVNSGMKIIRSGG